MKKKNRKKWVVEGEVVEAHPNAMFRVQLDNGNQILGSISGKIRRKSIRIMLGDRVQVEISRYDKTKGRIIFRFPPTPEPKPNTPEPKPKDSEDDSEG
uniref:Translation initiation factor IF-1, chloroplastic n=1 Tax=Menodora longiflora TaxID=389177 RepID=Q06QV2_9LAMI|nr:initiation factor 1 [Menodora longiflora]